MAYKNSGKKARIQGSGVKRSSYGIGGPGSMISSMQNFGAPKKSKRQTTKTHHNSLTGNRGNGGGKRNKSRGIFG